MTARLDSTLNDNTEPRPSLLPFDPADLVALRVSPAQFARMCEVSKQSVSQWIKQGKVTLGPDGKLDPAKAAREVFERTDPARLRARVFKSAMESREDLRGRVRDLDAALVRLRSEHAQELAWIEHAARNGFGDAQAKHLADLEDAIAADFDALILAHLDGTLGERLDDLVARIFYSGALAEAAAAEESSTDETAAGAPLEIKT
jgi:hypothetical protein